MSAVDEAERFALDVAKNEAFREELKAFGSDKVAVISHANAKGYDFTYADFEKIHQEGMLSDAQLDNVAGGMMVTVSNKGGTKVGLIGTDSGGCVFLKTTHGTLDNAIVW